MEEEIECLVSEDQVEEMNLQEITGEHNCLMNTSLASQPMEGEGAAHKITDVLADHEVLVTTMGDVDCSYSALPQRFEHHMAYSKEQAAELHPSAKNCTNH